ncbi:unnamed protein product [Brassica oleracea]
MISLVMSYASGDESCYIAEKDGILSSLAKRSKILISHFLKKDVALFLNKNYRPEHQEACEGWFMLEHQVL